MSMGINIPSYPLRFISARSFNDWLRNFYTPEQFSLHVRNHGKPIVRVPVERQTPNEADL